MKANHQTACGLLAFVMLPLLCQLVAADTDPLPLKVKATLIKGALLWPQPSKPDSTYSTQDVPVFPGVKFYSTVCGGPNVDRTAYVDKTNIRYSQNRGPSGNSLVIIYFFKNAKLEVAITETYKGTVLTKNVAVLSSLLDNASDRQIQAYTANERKAAAAAINTLIAHLDKFTTPNQEAACMAFITGPAKDRNQPYSPDLVKTVNYLKKTRAALLNFS